MSGTEGLSLVVANYQTPDDLTCFLKSVADHPPTCDWDLTAVNVCSRPEDRLAVEAWQDVLPIRWVINFPDNVGYARACNRAANMLEPQRDVIAFFNADVEATKGSLDRCHEALMAHNDWGVLGPRQVNERGRMTHAGIFGTHASPIHRGWQEKDRQDYEDVRSAVTVSGSAYFVKRSVWEELTRCAIYRSVAEAEGAFLPTQHYYEETWCSYHAFAHGHRVMYFGEATMIHKWHRASPVGGFADQEMPRSRELFRRACDAHFIPHD